MGLGLVDIRNSRSQSSLYLHLHVLTHTLMSVSPLVPSLSSGVFIFLLFCLFRRPVLTSHIASTENSLTFRVRTMSLYREVEASLFVGWNSTSLFNTNTASLYQRRTQACNYGWRCYQSNATRASTANPRNSAQLGGIPYQLLQVTSGSVQ